MLAMVLPVRLGYEVMLMLSHAGDGAAKSCWQLRYQGNFATMQCRCRVMLAMVLLSHAGNGIAEATWPRHNVDAESCWRRCYQVMLAMVLMR
jgi:hypothetical protein